MLKCKLSLIQIFLYTDRIIFVFSHIWTQLENLSKYGKMRIQKCPYTGKYGSEKARILAFFIQWSPRKAALTFSKLRDWRPVTLPYIYFLDDFNQMCITAIFYSTYYQKRYIEYCLLPSANNVKQSSNESCFDTGKALFPDMMALSHHFELSPGYLRSLFLCKKKKTGEIYI